MLWCESAVLLDSNNWATSNAKHMKRDLEALKRKALDKKYIIIYVIVYVSKMGDVNFEKNRLLTLKDLLWAR